MEIQKVEIQPATGFAIKYSVGEQIGNIGKGTVSAIKQLFDTEINQFYIVIEVDGTRFAEYYGTPFAVFYQ